MSRVQLLCQDLPKLEIIVPLREFTLFPDLPPELRHRIWRFAAMVPRSIRLRRLDYSSTYDDQPDAPAIMRTSRESRWEGKRYYTLFRELKHIETEQGLLDWTGEYIDYRRKKMVWINFKVDRFMWDLTLLPRHSMPADLETHFNFEDFVIKSIRYLQCECALHTIFLFRALNFFERLLLEESTLFFKFGYRGWCLEQKDRYGCQDLLHLELATTNAKRNLLKMLAQQEGISRVEFQVEIS
ncbi:hypothetical protein V8E51_019818 [Hyaloscypha variabilis]